MNAFAVDTSCAPVSKRSWAEHFSVRHFAEYWPTVATEFSVLVSQIISYKLAAHFLGQHGFSEYAVVRRAVSLISPLPLLGMAVGLPRYIAYSNGAGDRDATERYYGATLRCVGSAIAVCVLLLNILQSKFAFLIFGDRAYSGLILPVSVLVAGASLHALVYSYFRGHLAMGRANILQFTNLGLVPILCFIVLRLPVQRFLLLLGAAWLCIALIALCSTPVRSIALPASRETAELLRYGLQRLPGDFILLGLLSVPVIFVAHRSGLEQAGFVAFAISVLSMIGAFFSPIGLILLPKASALLAAGKKDVLRVHVNRLIRVAITVSALATVLIFVFARFFIRAYLGAGFEQAVGTMQWVVLGAVPYALFTVLRNLIDAFHRNAVTAIITIGSFAVFALGSWITVGHLAGGRDVLLAFLIALTALGGAAWVECNRILRHES